MKRLLSVFLALLGGAGVVVCVWLLSNAFDAELTPEARRIVDMNVASAEPADETNAYFWLTALGAPDPTDPAAFARTRLAALVAGPPAAVQEPRFALDDKTVDCRPEHYDCLNSAADKLMALMDLLETEAWREQLTDRMRAAPLFVEIHGAMGPEMVAGDAGHLLKAQAFTIARVRLSAAIGEWDIAVSELEKDMAFQRRALASVHNIVPKMIAAYAINRNVRLAADLWRTHGKDLAAQRERLRQLAAPIPEKDLSLVLAGELDRGAFVGLLAREGRDGLLTLAGLQQPTLRDRVEQLLFLPQQTANDIVAQFVEQRPVLNGDTRAFDAARAEWQRGRPAEDQAPWWQTFAFRNSSGRLMATEGEMDMTPYQASLHDLQATLALVRARLSVPPVPTMQDWEAALQASDLTDPYSGARLIIDPELLQPTIAARRLDAGWAQFMLKATGGRLVAAP